MKVLTACFLLVCLAAALAVAPTQAAADPVQEFTAIEKAWLAAEQSGDRDALDRLYADDFKGVAFGPELLTKSDLLPQAGPSGWDGATLEDVKVNRYGDTAVVFDLLKAAKPPNTAEMRFTKVYRNEGGKWRLVAAHLSKVGSATTGVSQ